MNRQLYYALLTLGHALFLPAIIGIISFFCWINYLMFHSIFEDVTSWWLVVIGCFVDAVVGIGIIISMEDVVAKPKPKKVDPAPITPPAKKL